MDEATGVVTPLKSGKTTITVAALDGSGVSSSYTLTVDPACPVEITGCSVCYTAGGDSNCLFITPRNTSYARTVMSFRFRVDCYDGNNQFLCSYDCAWEGEGFPALAPGQEGSSGDWHWKDLFYCVYADRVDVIVTQVDFDNGDTWTAPDQAGTDDGII